jgi:hypothetical protein
VPLHRDIVVAAVPSFLSILTFEKQAMLFKVRTLSPKTVAGPAAGSAPEGSVRSEVIDVVLVRASALVSHSFAEVALPSDRKRMAREFDDNTTD